MAIYEADSFFTLTGHQRAGLLALTAAMAWALLVAVRRLPGPRAGRVAAALAMGWAFVWLSPQAYYAYYQVILAPLPWQVVLGPPPGPGRMLRLMTFTQEHSLSRHGQGALVWALLAAALPATRGSGRRRGPGVH